MSRLIWIVMAAALAACTPPAEPVKHVDRSDLEFKHGQGTGLRVSGQARIGVVREF